MNKKKLILTLIIASLFLTFFARYNLSFAESYALNVYPIFSETISSFLSKFSFSLAEYLILAAIIILVVYFIVVFVMTIRDMTLLYFKDFVINLSLCISIIYFLFVLFCGLNYYRYEFTYYSKLTIEPSSKEQLVKLNELLINDANEKRASMETSNNTAKLFDANLLGTTRRAKESMDKLSKEYDVLKGDYAGPKLVKASKLMSHMRITGVFFPFTFEANVNKDIPPYQLPSTMLHELVHLRGFMREDEANFIAYLASVNSDFDDFSYSGTMLALAYSMNALYKEDKDEYARVYNMYSDRVKMDLRYSGEYWSNYTTKIADISNKVNDTYLKANNQQDGVKSYGRMVDLLLAYYDGVTSDT